ESRARTRPSSSSEPCSQPSPPPKGAEDTASAAVGSHSYQVETRGVLAYFDIRGPKDGRHDAYSTAACRTASGWYAMWHSATHRCGWAPSKWRVSDGSRAVIKESCRSAGRREQMCDRRTQWCS